MGPEYWFAYWWLFPIALGICVLVCLVGVEGAILFVPFYAVVFPWMTDRPVTPLEAIQIGLITEIFGFTSSFVGFYRAALVDWRIGLISSAAGIPLALAGAVLAYRLPQPALLLIVAASLPLLAWYLRRPVEAESSRAGEPSQSGHANARQQCRPLSTFRCVATPAVLCTTVISRQNGAAWTPAHQTANMSTEIAVAASIDMRIAAELIDFW